MAYDTDQYDPLGRYQGPIGATTAPAAPVIARAPRVIGRSGVAGFPEPTDNPEAGPITNVRYRGPSDSPTGIFSSPFEIGPAQGMNDRGAGPLARAANAAPSVAPIGAANAAPSQPITPAVAPIAAESERTPGTSVRLEGATPAMLQAIAADMQGGRNYSPIAGPQRTRAGPSRASELQALSATPEKAQPVGTGARIEQYFTPPEGPVGGPLNRGGVQVQNAEGTVTTQAPDVAGQPVTPQIRPQAPGPNDTVQVIGPGGGGYIQHFEDGGYKVAQGPGESAAQAEQRYAAQIAARNLVHQKIINGDEITPQDRIVYQMAHGVDTSREATAQATVEAARLHSAATLAAAQAHAEAAKYVADEQIKAGQVKEVDIPVGGTELGQGMGKPNVIKGIYDARAKTITSPLGVYDVARNVFTPAPANAAPQSQTWEQLKALRPALSAPDFQRHLAGLPPDELAKGKKERADLEGQRVVGNPGTPYAGQVGTVVNGQFVPAMALPPGMKRQVGTTSGKPVYEDEKGNRFVDDTGGYASGGIVSAGRVIGDATARRQFKAAYGPVAKPLKSGLASGGLVDDPLEAANAALRPQTRASVIEEMRRARGQAGP